ncbi:MAG: hypothetical protein N3G21_04170 [Candidatus Hydrogenedentes bacterium]|nr:hypothetical protein [Candidatus Hydrogenedentota bacterium]
MSVFSIGLVLFYLTDNEYINQTSFKVEPSRVYAGYPFRIALFASIGKDKYPYCFYPIKIDEVGNTISLNFREITTYESENRTNIEISIEAISEAPGAYEIGPFRLPYLILSPDIEKELISQNTGVIPTSYIEFPKVSVDVRDWRKTCLIWVGIITSFLFLLLLGTILLGRRFLPRKADSLSESSIEFYEILHSARGYRLDGNIYGFLKTLLTVVQKLSKDGDSPEIKNMIDRLEATISEVGYKGKTISESELDWYWKEVEKLVRSKESNKVRSKTQNQ